MAIRLVLADDHAWNTVEKNGAAAHGTRRQRRVHHRFAIHRRRLTTRLLERVHLSVQHRAPALDPPIVAAPDDAATVNEDRADRNSPFAFTVPGFVKNYHYPNNDRASTLWYHDHRHLVTAQNVYSGMAAFYPISDPFERAQLPQGEFDVPLMISDALFNADGSLAEMCGNGVRVVGKYLGDRDHVGSSFDLETRAGVKHLELHADDRGVIDRVTVDMGAPAAMEEERALVVDAIQDQRQVVIKGLEENYGEISGIAAATILGDGRIALILDPDVIVSDAARNSAATDNVFAQAG